MPLKKSLVGHQNKTIIPQNDGSLSVCIGPITENNQIIPTCAVCEKVLIAEMKNKFPLFRLFYTFGFWIIRFWMYISLSSAERTKEENNAIRKCRTCEKVYLRRLRAVSPRFNNFYRLLDATIEGWIEKFLTDEDRERAFARDPVHAKALMKFNPRNYFLGEEFILAIKFDGCIAEETEEGFPETIGKLMPDVQNFLVDLKNKGVKIVVFGWRSNAHTRGNPQYRKIAERWMKEHGVPFDFFYDGKEILNADAFISNRNLGNDLNSIRPLLLSIIEDPDKTFLKRRHIL